MDDNGVVQPIKSGKDADQHTQNLQGNVASVLGVPVGEVVPIKSQGPGRPLGIDLENLEENINASVPWKTPTSRLAKSKEFLNKIMEKLRKKNPGKDIKVEEKK